MIVSFGISLFSNDSLDKDLLVLENVTLGQHVELLVHLRLDLASGSVFSEESSESSLSPDPENFLGHSGISATSSLTDSHMSTFSLFRQSLKSSESGVDFDISLSDKAVLDKESNVISGRSGADLLSLLRVEPDSVLTTF